MMHIPIAAFWTLIVVGVHTGELSYRSAGIFAGIWLATCVITGGFTTYTIVVSVLFSIILMLKIFGGDLRL